MFQVELEMRRARAGIVRAFYREYFTTILCIPDTMAFMIWKLGTIVVLMQILNYGAFNTF